jgi:hypothetical protein
MRARFGGPATAALAAALVLVVVIEGRGLPFDPTDRQAQPRVPPPPADVSDVTAPQLWLPAESADDNRAYVLWSTDGFPDLVNGRSSIQPEYTAGLIGAMDRFPDRGSVALLRRTGVRSVILDLGRVADTPQRHAASRSIAGLGIDRERRGDVIVYLIGLSGHPARTVRELPFPPAFRRRRGLDDVVVGSLWAALPSRRPPSLPHPPGS